MYLLFFLSYNSTIIVALIVIFNPEKYVLNKLQDCLIKLDIKFWTKTFAIMQ